MKLTLQQQIDTLTGRIESLERTVRMQRQHRVEPVLVGGGYELRRVRKVAGWTLRQLAACLEVSRMTLQRYELDVTPMPRWRAQQVVGVFRNSGALVPRWGDLNAWTEDEDKVLSRREGT